MTIRVPYGYRDQYVTLDWLEDELVEHYHPHYVRRLIAWLAHKNGTIGVGGAWRAGGAQPDRPGFAPEGKSFHQDQNYNDGFTGACAVDLVCPNGNRIHRAPRWDEVPAQGSAEAERWGLHCNVGSPGQVGSEPWHMQPIEIDGWQSWWNAGRPAPKSNYPIPGAPPPPEPTPAPPSTEERIMTPDDGIYIVAKLDSNGSFWLSNGKQRWHSDGKKRSQLRVAAGLVDLKTGRIVHDWSEVGVVGQWWIDTYMGLWDGQRKFYG